MMKTLKNLISLFALTIVFLSCEPPVEPLVTDIVPDQEYFQAAAVLLNTNGAPDAPTSAISSLYRRFSGEGESELFDHIVMQSSHRELYQVGSGTFDIENGEFSIEGESGELIYGTYTGVGTNIAGLIQLSQEITILGGSGRYVNASGNLFMLSKRLINSNSMKVTINGTIYKPNL